MNRHEGQRPSKDASQTRRRRFDAIFTAHYEHVLAYALRRTREPELAEDAVSETFFTAWRKLDEVPDDALPWLYAVARRALANARRSRRRRQALVSRLTHEMRYALAQHPDPAEALEMSEALERLTDEDREILMLVAWEGLTSDRAALAMGFSPEVFSVRLHRARRRLQKEIDHLGGGPRRKPEKPEEAGAQ